MSATEAGEANPLKIHMARVVTAKLYGHTATVTGMLCGRTNRRSQDGMNSTGNRDEVTRRFCQKLMKPIPTGEASRD